VTRASVVAAALAALAGLAVPARADDTKDPKDTTTPVADPVGTTEPTAQPVYETSTFQVAPVSKKKSITGIAVENSLGDVRVEGHDAPGLIIETIKRANDTETLDRLRVSLIPDPDGTYRIDTLINDLASGKPVEAGSVRIDLVIRAPRDAHVDGRVGDGTLALVNMDAGGELDAATGRIEVKNVAGPVFARTVDAPMSLTEVFGVIDAQVLAGDVSLDTVRGDRLSASVHKGKIEGRRVRSRQVDLITTSGDVELEGEAPIGATISILSVKGTIDVRLRGSGGLSVRARGRKVDLGKGGRGDDGTYRGLFGKHADKPGQVELRTRYGDIRFAFIE
jgi:hypothetical protein